jgi:hypothetical protein
MIPFSKKEKKKTSEHDVILLVSITRLGYMTLSDSDFFSVLVTGLASALWSCLNDSTETVGEGACSKPSAFAVARLSCLNCKKLFIKKGRGHITCILLLPVQLTLADPYVMLPYWQACAEEYHLLVLS